MKRPTWFLILGLVLLPCLLAAAPSHFIETLVPHTSGFLPSYTFKEEAVPGTSGLVTQALLSSATNNLLSQTLSAPSGAALVVHGGWDPGISEGPMLGGKKVAFRPGSLGVQFIVKVKLGTESKPAAFPWIEGTVYDRTAALVVAGPRARTGFFSPAKGRIWVGCPSSSGKVEAWFEVPLEDKVGVAHYPGGGFVTGRAGFFTENKVKMFFVEYLAWPEDPVEIGD